MKSPYPLLRPLILFGCISLPGCSSSEASAPGAAAGSPGGTAAQAGAGMPAGGSGGGGSASGGTSATTGGVPNGNAGGQAAGGSAGAGPNGACASPAPVKIIFDTDIGPDCDDAGAVAMLHTLADRCEVEIVGMVSATSFQWGAGALDALNTYYGRPDIPIGALKEPGFLERSDYSRYLAENFPNDLKTAANAQSDVELFHSVLESQPDASVTIVSVGPLRAASNLIRSPGGRDLVAKKVKEWVVMGGSYAAGREWNFEQDGAASREAVENWPTPIMFSGGEVGSGVTTGTRLFSETDEQNPTRKAYEISTDVGDNGRLSWDLTAVLYAARGLEPFFTAVTNGYNEVTADGSNRWESSPNRGHSYMVKKPGIGKVLGWAMDELVVGSKVDLLPKTPPLSKMGWKATANPGQDVAMRAIDGDYESQWGTGRPMAVGDWIAVDMGQSTRINRIELDQNWTGSEYPRGYELYFSDDGVSWGEPVKTGRGSAVTIIAFEARSTRHLKLVQTGILTKEYGNLQREWMMRELSVFLEAP